MLLRAKMAMLCAGLIHMTVVTLAALILLIKPLTKAERYGPYLMQPKSNTHLYVGAILPDDVFNSNMDPTAIYNYTSRHLGLMSSATYGFYINSPALKPGFWSVSIEIIELDTTSTDNEQYFVKYINDSDNITIANKDNTISNVQSDAAKQKGKWSMEVGVFNDECHTFKRFVKNGVDFISYLAETDAQLLVFQTYIPRQDPNELVDQSCFKLRNRVGETNLIEKCPPRWLWVKDVPDPLNVTKLMKGKCVVSWIKRCANFEAATRGCRGHGGQIGMVTDEMIDQLYTQGLYSGGDKLKVDDNVWFSLQYIDGQYKAYGNQNITYIIEQVQKYVNVSLVPKDGTWCFTKRRGQSLAVPRECSGGANGFFCVIDKGYYDDMHYFNLENATFWPQRQDCAIYADDLDRYGLGYTPPVSTIPGVTFSQTLETSQTTSKITELTSTSVSSETIDQSTIEQTTENHNTSISTESISDSTGQTTLIPHSTSTSGTTLKHVSTDKIGGIFNTATTESHEAIKPVNSTLVRVKSTTVVMRPIQLKPSTTQTPVYTPVKKYVYEPEEAFAAPVIGSIPLAFMLIGLIAIILLDSQRLAQDICKGLGHLIQCFSKRRKHTSDATLNVPSRSHDDRGYLYRQRSSKISASTVQEDV
ncbi:unnamed protein product [Owenia fusiformis]|uniref:Uncharacterized protein n=1 Tax=Owenia fusiformis TaxID=6347 RepID=A0A8J1XLM6_OWEFU|nr:unnamed protein product [Owenia fusiformis]